MGSYTLYECFKGVYQNFILLLCYMHYAMLVTGRTKTSL